MTNIKTQSIIFFILIVLTGVTYLCSTLEATSQLVSVFVFVIALIKGALVSEFFMQLRDISGIWRWPIIFWLLIVGLIIGTSIFIG